MRSIALLTAWLLIASCPLLHAQTLFTYGNQPVSKEEFIRAFLKNNDKQKFSEKDYRDYLDLYTRFKLKVQAALDQRLDTLAAQKAENNEFRSQVIEQFLHDPASVNKLVQEAFVRSRKDIHVGHIFVPLKAGVHPAPAPGAVAANQIFHRINTGDDFRDVAARYSFDTSAKTNGGDIGWITVFTLPYEFENIIYHLAPGKVSQPYESRIGYHIFKNLEERKAVGKVRAAQILVALPPDANEAVRRRIQQKADSIYNLLQKGASFTDLVSRYSDDRTSKPNGGGLPEFGPGQYEFRFDSAVFALTRPGAITRPILTSFGYHIVQLLERVPVTDSANKEAMAIMRQQVQTEAARMEIARQAAQTNMFAETGFRKYTPDPGKFSRYTDSMLRGARFPDFQDQTVLFSFEKEKVYASDWITYLKAIGGVEALNGRKTYDSLLNLFMQARLEQYYRNHLEAYNPAFAAQMKEVKEGNLYFEVMQQQVWQKAAADTAALQRYYAQNKNRYWWEASADAILFSCRDSATAYALRSKLEKGIKDWRQTTASYGENVQSDSGRFELTQLPVQQSVSVSPGQLTPVKGTPENPSYSFAGIIHAYPNRSPRNFNDSKGFVLNDYQSYLEDKWIDSLKTRYPVKVDETVLRSLWK